VNPFKYKLAEVRKLIVSLLFAVAAVVGLFVTIDPTFVQACVALVGPVFAVIGVFGATDKSSDELQKALEQLKGAGLTVVGYFTVVPPSTAARISTLIVAVASVFGVYWIANKKPREAQYQSVESATTTVPAG
jgi:hypothetical protein